MDEKKVELTEEKGGKTMDEKKVELTEEETAEVNGGITPVAVYIADTVALEVCKHTSCIGRDCEQFEQ